LPSLATERSSTAAPGSRGVQLPPGSGYPTRSVEPEPTTASSGNSGQPIRARARPDLVPVATQHRSHSAVVIKDPVAMKYHRLRPDEYLILSRLDGDVTLAALRDAYERRYAPTKVSLSQLNDLVLRLYRLGLVLSQADGQGDELARRHRNESRQRILQRFSSILFIRFPGVDPAPVLRRLYPVARPLFSPLGLVLGAALIIAAIGTFATTADRFVAELPEMRQWLQLRAVVVLAIVLAATKVVHELAHALVCKHFGGECHEIGPMLLVFTPALYCDTSDSWTFPNRWHRAAVGAAGITAEVLLASAATLLWASSEASLVHFREDWETGSDHRALMTTVVAEER